MICNYEVESTLLKKNYRYICGIDEVGRGAIFGPVVSGAVILDSNCLNFEINDSKLLGQKKRRAMAEYIYHHSLAFSIGWCWNEEIDEFNILEATKKSIVMAVKRLQIPPDYVLIDGMEPTFLGTAGKGINKGDKKCISIASASIIAKVFRDQLMDSFTKFFPDYGFDKNKGYPTKKHVDMVLLKGLSEFHRQSFRIKRW